MRWVIYLLIITVVINVVRAGKYALYQYLDDRGFSRQIFYESPLSYTKSIINYFLETNTTTDSKIPTIVIDIKFKNWKKLEQSRNNALKEGLILKKEKKFVKASIRYNDQLIKAKVRLKGDFTDHLEGDKWSLRVKTKKDDHLFGMRSFSLQNPKTRGNLGEPLFLEMLRKNGILAPRYLFVNEIINGNKIGVMALEEHFSKEILEANERKESVIIKLDETLFWENKANNNSDSYHNYTAASISAFNEKRIEKSSSLKSNYRVAVGLLRSFISGSLKASDVFDVELLGRYLAIVDTWGAWHAVAWHNIRFSYNPYTAKLEPIGYDGGTDDQKDIADVPTENQNFAKRFLEDGYVRLAYINSIKKINRDLHNPVFIDKFNEQGDYYLSILRDEQLFMPDSRSILDLITKRSDSLNDKWADNSLIVSFDNCNNNYINGWAINVNEPQQELSFDIGLNKLALNIDANLAHDTFNKHNLSILGLMDNKHGFSISKEKLQGMKIMCPQLVYRNDSSKALMPILENESEDIKLERVNTYIPSDYITPAHVFLVSRGNKTYIEVDNIVPYEFTVSKIIMSNADKNFIKTLTLPVPIHIPAKIKDKIYNTVNIDMSEYVSSDLHTYALLLESKIDPTVMYKVNAKPYFSKMSKHPIPNKSLASLLKLHPYLTLNKTEKVLSIQTGNHYVADNIIVPAGYTLKIPPAVILTFSPKAYILSFGNLISVGTKSSPVIMQSSNSEKKWHGVISIGNGSQTTQLKNTIIKNTSSLQTENWSLTGGITIYKNKYVDIDSCTFTNNSSEDFINIIHSNFSIKNTKIQSAISDAFDADFSDGEISHSSFVDIGAIGGGDAVDISGSNLSIQSTTFANVDDKAISVGEGSVLHGDYLTIIDSGTGIASKDGSKVYINNSTIEKSSIAGVMSYVKKSEYGPSFMDMNNITFKNNNFNSLAQIGSKIIIDGKVDKTINLNVDALYDSIMKSGLK